MARNMVEKPFRSKYYHSITPPFSRHPRSHVLIRRSMVATGDLDNIGVKRISKPPIAFLQRVSGGVAQ